MSVADFDELLRIEEYSFNDHDRMNVDDLHGFLDAHGSGFFMINVEGHVAGYILFMVEDGRGYMESIAIDRRFRGQGIANTAINFMVRELRGRGVHSLMLHVREDNAGARALYEKNGFIMNGKDPDFYGAGLDACVYSMDLG